MPDDNQEPVEPSQKLDPALLRFIDECIVELIIRSLKRDEEEPEVQ